MRAVNLIPRVEVGDDRRTWQEATVATVGGGAAALLCLVLAGLFLAAGSGVSAKERELGELEAQKTELTRESEASGVSALVAERRVRESALAAALSTRVAWDRVLRRLALVLPRDVWVSGLTAASPTSTTAATSAAPPASGATPTGFTLRGYAPSQPAVARTLARVAVLPDLSDVQLLSSTESILERRRLFAFTIAANVRPSGAGQ